MGVRGIEPGKKAALLISECQRGVVEEGMSLFPSLVEQFNSRKLVERISALADTFREHGLPVVHLHVAHRPGYVDLPPTSLIMARSRKLQTMQQGSDQVQPIAGLEPREGDIVHSRSFALVAFNGTDADAMLRHMGVQTLVLAGVSSNIAIPGMAVCASDLGYQVVVPEDCIAGATLESHRFSVENTLPLVSTVTTSEEVSRALAGL